MNLVTRKAYITLALTVFAVSFLPSPVSTIKCAQAGVLYGNSSYDYNINTSRHRGVNRFTKRNINCHPHIS